MSELSVLIKRIAGARYERWRKANEGPLPPGTAIPTRESCENEVWDDLARVLDRFLAPGAKVPSVTFHGPGLADDPLVFDFTEARERRPGRVEERPPSPGEIRSRMVAAVARKRYTRWRDEQGSPDHREIRAAEKRAHAKAEEDVDAALGAVGEAALSLAQRLDTGEMRTSMAEEAAGEVEGLVDVAVVRSSEGAGMISRVLDRETLSPRARRELAAARDRLESLASDLLGDEE